MHSSEMQNANVGLYNTTYMHLQCAESELRVLKGQYLTSER